MGMKCVVSQHCRIEPFGEVHLRVLHNAVNVTARWRGDVLHVSAPPVSADRLREILTGMEPRIMAHRPSKAGPMYHDGFSFATDGWRFEIVASQALRRNHVDAIRPDASGEPGYFRIRYGEDSDMASEAMQQTIGRVVKAVGKFVAERLLIAQAYEEASRLGIPIPAGHITVGRGIRRLGCCSARGRISLSYILMFVDTESRRRTILHEFAHLRHFNHSPEFYALWDSYLGYPHHRVRLADMHLPLPGI